MITEKMLRELTSIGNSVRTPLYIVNRDDLRENINLLRKALESRFERFICYASANVFYGIYSKCKTNSKIRGAGYGVNHSFFVIFLNKELKII